MQILSEAAEEKLIDKMLEIVSETMKRIEEGQYSKQRYIRADKVMEYTGIKSLSTLKKWKDTGLLNPIIIDGYTAYDKIEIDLMMAGHKFTE